MWTQHTNRSLRRARRSRYRGQSFVDRAEAQDFSHRRERRAANDLFEPRLKTAQAKVVRELPGQRQCHARRIAIDFPRMNDECNGNAAAVALGDRSEDPRRVAHPKAPADPQWDVLPEASVDGR